MPTSPLFSLQNIHFTHQGKSTPVLCGVNLSLYPNECIGITGANGGGKSTLLHIGAGLIPPSSGSIHYGINECKTEADFVIARKKLGYLLQNAENQLFCSSILEDVAFGPYNLGYSEKEAEGMAHAMLKKLGLLHLASANGQRLSGGEQKLAALATIFVMQVDFLFLDEPTSNLDPAACELLCTTLKLYNLPSIIISHDKAFLHKLCTRTLLLENGKLCPVEL